MIKQRILTEPVLEDGVLTELTEIAPQLVLVFCSIRFLFADDFVAALRAVFSRSVLIGCSTAGEVGLDGVSEGSCVITAVRFEGDARVRLAEAHITDMADSEAAGVYVGRTLASPELRAVLLFGSGVEINGSSLIAGVAAQVGSAVPVEEAEELTMLVRGRDFVTGLPRTTDVRTNDTVKAIGKELREIVRAMRDVLQETPPELSADIIDRGITMTGGSSLLRNFAELVFRRIGVKAAVADDALYCVAKGTGIALNHLDTYKKAIIAKR